MQDVDVKILRLIELLRFQNKISSVREFCDEIKLLEQTVSKIKKGKNHFTVLHIKNICKIYEVNANWIFGIENQIFSKTINTQKSPQPI